MLALLSLLKNTKLIRAMKRLWTVDHYPSTISLHLLSMLHYHVHIL